MNTRLLRRVQKHILAEPRRLNMNQGVARVEKEVSPCGTVGCIFGWCAVLGKTISKEQIKDMGRMELRWGQVRRAACTALKIDETPVELVHVCNWPSDLRVKYCATSDQNERAKLTVERIERFITENKGKRRKKVSYGQ